MSISTLNEAATVEVYTPFRIEGSRATYIGDDHSDVAKDDCLVSSAAPKKGDTSYGVRRSTVKFIKTVNVAKPGSVETNAMDLKVELSVSLPVGTLSTDLLEARARLVGLMKDDALLQSIVSTGQIEL